MKACLLDTGPIVALLDKSEPKHDSVRDQMSLLRSELHTTGAVVTEVFHILAEVPGGPSSIAEFLKAGAVRVHDVFAPDTLVATASLMEKYQSIPMDFADATLVWLAEQRGMADILTLDRRGFTVFRYGRNHRFRMLIN